MLNRNNKKENALTITVIFVTIFMICTILTIGFSYWENRSFHQQKREGMNYDIELTEPREDQVSMIKSMSNVSYAGMNVKCSVLSRYQEKPLDNVSLFWLDRTSWENQLLPAFVSYEGYYPQKADEIMLSQSTIQAMGIKKPAVGMKLRLTYQTLAEASFGADMEKDFVLSGFFLDDIGQRKGFVSEAFFETTGAKQTDLSQGSLKITFANPLWAKKDIMEMQKKIALSENQMILADYDSISKFQKTMFALFFFLLLVLLGGFLFIYHIRYGSGKKNIHDDYQ